MPPLVEPVLRLSAAEAQRTSRHAVLAGFGDAAQRRLAAAHVAVVGAGGIGSPVVMALAAAGVGILTIIDDDTVELANLQRQIAHSVADVGQPKAASAARTASALAPEARIIELDRRLTPDNATELLTGADLVVDGSDTFATRRAVAAACEALGVPLVWGVVQESHAQATVFWSAPPTGIRPVVLDDLYPAGSGDDAPTCQAVGVLGPLCLQLGALLAVEAVKLITGTGEALIGRLVLIDAMRGTQREVPLRATQREAHQPDGMTDAETPAAATIAPQQEVTA